MVCIVLVEVRGEAILADIPKFYCIYAWTSQILKIVLMTLMTIGSTCVILLRYQTVPCVHMCQFLWKIFIL